MTHFSKVFSAELEGIEARLIEVETDLHVGLHAFTIVGLADKALSEAKERVNAALKNTGVKAPNQENRKITVNLAPADVPKTGSHYDLAIAVGYLSATDQVRPFEVNGKIFLGELALDGAVRPIPGVLNIAVMAKKHGFTTLFVPALNAAEASLVPGLTIIPVSSLKGLLDHIEGRQIIPSQEPTSIDAVRAPSEFDISHVKGQARAKRALLIAAAGGHNLLMSGPPGTGKTMLAQTLASLLPPLSHEEMIEITQIYSAAGLLKDRPFIANRPFRSPHQSASPVAVIGGGSNPRPGEISLAHRGVLFLDEVPEFRRDLLEALRQPLENGRVIVSRVRQNLEFPAHFLFVAAMNPCPCGFYGDDKKSCQCSPHEILRYQKKISGPLLDRIDLQVEVPRISMEELRAKTEADSKETGQFKNQVAEARTLQQQRLKEVKRQRVAPLNSQMSSKEVEHLIPLGKSEEEFVSKMMEQSLLSTRGYYRVLKTARTIADLERAKEVRVPHLAEAFGYRLKALEA